MIATVIIDTIIISTLAKTCNHTHTVVLDNQTINIPATMAIRIKIIVTDMDFVTILTQPFYLIMYFLTDATDFRKTVINQEEYLHIVLFWGKIKKKFGIIQNSLYICGRKCAESDE